ncbi:MAG: class D beta-lactamase [Bdellovibrionales bacterium]|nr:class D beta-lactamase [Bdellovibrionales bacterium]
MRPIHFISFLLLLPAFASAEVDFKKTFADRDACIVISDLETGKFLAEHNPRRCKERFSPCSSFKVPAALMAFDKGILKDENQVVKWDGIKRARPEENQEQTPLTWMSNSIKWVTEWAIPQVGDKNIQHYLDVFGYGNKDFSGGLKDAWVTSSLKISAHEQLAFISKLWKGEFPVSQKATDLTKEIIFIKKIGISEFYGKTGTGCLVGHGCMEKPDKMLGNFIGILKSGSKTYAIAANASDLKDQERPAGPRLRNTTIEILKDMGLAKD